MVYGNVGISISNYNPKKSQTLGWDYKITSSNTDLLWLLILQETPKQGSDEELVLVETCGQVLTQTQPGGILATEVHGIVQC